MSQATMTIADGSGAAVLASINAALAALVTENSGASAPTMTFPFMTWADTSTGLLKMRDATNTFWIVCQPLSVVGTTRNLRASVTAASTSITFQADEVILETALGGTAYKIANLNKTLNMAGGPGAGYMDTGAAGPVSGFCAIYAIYNPTTQTVALLGYNATSANAPNVYGGANMPSGYTASALLMVWPTNASSQFKPGLQIERRLVFPYLQAINTTTQQASLTSLSISGIVPPNAKAILPGVNISFYGAAGEVNSQVASDANGSGAQIISLYSSVGSSQGEAIPMPAIPLSTNQTIFYSLILSSVTLNFFIITIAGYEI